jgi:hypothetical protein
MPNLKFTDRQNVDKIAENVECIWHRLTALRKDYLRRGRFFKELVEA